MEDGLEVRLVGSHGQSGVGGTDRFHFVEGPLSVAPIRVERSAVEAAAVLGVVGQRRLGSVVAWSAQGFVKWLAWRSIVTCMRGGTYLEK